MYKKRKHLCAFAFQPVKKLKLRQVLKSNLSSLSILCSHIFFYRHSCVPDPVLFTDGKEGESLIRLSPSFCMFSIIENAVDNRIDSAQETVVYC